MLYIESIHFYEKIKDYLMQIDEKWKLTCFSKLKVLLETNQQKKMWELYKLLSTKSLNELEIFQSTDMNELSKFFLSDDYASILEQVKSNINLPKSGEEFKKEEIKTSTKPLISFLNLTSNPMKKFKTFQTCQDFEDSQFKKTFEITLLFLKIFEKGNSLFFKQRNIYCLSRFYESIVKCTEIELKELLEDLNKEY